MLLIRRYARAMRELQSEAIKARGTRAGVSDKRPGVAPESLIAAAQSLAADPPSSRAQA